MDFKSLIHKLNARLLPAGIVGVMAAVMLGGFSGSVGLWTAVGLMMLALAADSGLSLLPARHRPPFAPLAGVMALYPASVCALCCSFFDVPDAWLKSFVVNSCAVMGVAVAFGLETDSRGRQKSFIAGACLSVLVAMLLLSPLFVQLSVWYLMTPLLYAALILRAVFRHRSSAPAPTIGRLNFLFFLVLFLQFAMR